MTLTSTRPAALPASITARSEISGRPFGRITHSAPFGFSERFRTASRTSSFASIAPKKIASLFSSVRPTTTSATAPRSSRRNSGSPTETTEARHSGLTPIFSRRVRCLKRSALLSLAAFLATRRLHERAALALVEALDRVANGGPWNRSAIHAQVPFEPRRVGFAGFAQRPAHGFVNQVFRCRDAVARQRRREHRAPRLCAPAGSSR